MCGFDLFGFQVITGLLTVDEGGQRWLGPEHVLLSDVDSIEDLLQLQLQREPEHGVLQLNKHPLTPLQTFTMQELKSFQVRSDIQFTASYVMTLDVLSQENLTTHILSMFFFIDNADCLLNKFLETFRLMVSNNCFRLTEMTPIPTLSEFWFLLSFHCCFVISFSFSSVWTELLELQAFSVSGFH